MYFWPGVVAIWSALFFALASIVAYVLVDRGRTHLLATARSAYAAFATSIVAASGVLMALLLNKAAGRAAFLRIRSSIPVLSVASGGLLIVMGLLVFTGNLITLSNWITQTFGPGFTL